MSTALDTNKAIISLAEAKEYLNVTSSSDDLILNHLINAISGWVGNYLKRDLVSKEHVEYYTGDNSSCLMLRNYPVISVDSVYVDSLRQWSSDTLIDPDNYIIQKGRGILEAFNLLGEWAQGQSNIKITYTAGYTVGVDAGSGTMPYEIRMAVKRLLDLNYRIGFSHRKLDYASESISGMNITFKDSEIPKDVKNMLAGYKQMIHAPQFDYEDSTTTTPSLASASGTFTNSDLVDGILTITHSRNLSAPYTIQVAIFDNNSALIVPDSVVGSANAIQISLASYAPITGTWGYIYAS